MSTAARIGCLLVALILLVIAGAADAEPVKYHLGERAVGTSSYGKVRGTITTDGKLGVLGPEHIVEFDLELTFGDTTIPVVGSAMESVYPPTQSSAGSLIGGGLSATTTGLVFDFDASGALLAFRHDGENYWCLGATGPPTCFFGLDRTEMMAVSASLNGMDRTGAHAVAEAIQVPVAGPGGWVLLAIALAGLGTSGLRRTGSRDDADRQGR